MKRQQTTATTTDTDLEKEPRLLWLAVARAPELELRRRSRNGPGFWRLRCPADDSHELTVVNGRPGLALTCHGPGGWGSPGHSLAVHERLRDALGAVRDADSWRRFPDLPEIAWPCRFCGCAESQVLAAFGARPRDKFSQAEAQRDGRCRCGATGYRVAELPVLCLAHLADRVGLDRDVLSEGFNA